MNFTRARAGALIGLLGLGASAAFVACGGDDTAPVTGSDAGKDSPTADTNPPPSDSSPPPDTGSDADTSTLYQRLGGHVGIKAFVLKVVSQLDPEVLSYFVLNAPTPYPNRPSMDDIAECFTNLTGSATGGPETYPSKAPSGFQCRLMAEVHKGLLADGGAGSASDINFHIPNPDFNKFVGTIAAVAKAGGLADTDIAKMGALLGTQHDAIVDPDAGDTGAPFNALPYCDAGDNRPGCYPASDAGDAGDAPADG